MAEAQWTCQGLGMGDDHKQFLCRPRKVLWVNGGEMSNDAWDAVMLNEE